jgi:hypothetical protein
MVTARQLLSVARGMPEAADLLRHIKELHGLFQGAVHVEIDNEEFSARVLAKWDRYNI